MKKLRIAEFIDSYYPCIDGVMNVVTNYCRNFNNEKAECKLITPAAKKSDHYKDCQPFEVVRCLSVSAPEGYRCGFPEIDAKLDKQLKTEHFDIFHVHSPFNMGLYAIRQAKKRGIPVIVTLHTKYHEDFKRTLHGNKVLCDYMIKRIMRVFNNADYVWAVTESTCQVLRDYGYKGKIDVVRNGTDMRYPDNPEQLVQTVNEKHGLFGKKNVFIFVGRIAAYKNIYLLADALKILSDNGTDFTMIMVGGGFDEEDFKKYTQKLGIYEKFLFAGIVSDRDLLQGYYLRSDVFLFPSVFDNGPIVCLEAAANKIPSLYIRGSSAAEQIVDNENGFLCEENAQSIADRVTEIIKDPALVKRVGENAYRTVYRNWDRVTEEVLSKYEEIIEDYSARRAADLMNRKNQKTLKKSETTD